MTNRKEPNNEGGEDEAEQTLRPVDGPGEPMDELLAELLAQEAGPVDGVAVYAASDPEEPQGLEEELERMLAAEAEEMPVAVAAGVELEVAADVEELEEPEELEALAAGGRLEEEEAPVEEVAVEAPLEVAKSSDPVSSPYYLRPFEAEAAMEPAEEEAEPADSEVELLKAETVTQEQAAVAQAPPAAAALSPQPALEDLVASIDQALETSPRITPVTEPAPAAVHKQFSQLDDYVVFSLSGSDYAVPVRDVAEIGRIPVITRVPNVPDFMRGITNLRGEVVPVLNLPALLGLQDSAPTARGRVLFLQQRERVSPTGLLVDEVKGIQRIQSQQLEQVTGLVDDKVTSVLRGVHGRGDRLLNVLDLEQLFGLQEFQQLGTR